MPNPKLILYLDQVSPFSYFAFHIVRNSPVFEQCDVTYVPILLNGVLKATGNIPPLDVKNKDKWIDMEWRRWVSQFNIPMANKIPDGFPVATLATQRFVAAVSLVAPEKIGDVIAALYHALFVENKQISTPGEFIPIVEPVLGKETAAQALEKSTGDGKQLLFANTGKAVQDGAFGVPWYEAINVEGKKEFYWGFDHIGQVAAHLGLEKPQPGSAGEGGWKVML